LTNKACLDKDGGYSTNDSNVYTQIWEYVLYTTILMNTYKYAKM